MIWINILKKNKEKFNTPKITREIQKCQIQLESTLGELYGVLFPWLFFYKKYNVFDDQGFSRRVARVYNMETGKVVSESTPLYGAPAIYEYFDNEEAKIVKDGGDKRAEGVGAPFDFVNHYPLPDDPNERLKICESIDEDFLPEGIKEIKITNMEETCPNPKLSLA